MNLQRVNTTIYRKAWLAFVASLSCLLIYTLACVMSPPSWSPDSSKIAILVTPHEENPEKCAIFTYDIITGERVLLDEVKADGSLSAPAWSPDGEWIAYYRVEPSTPAEVLSVDSNSISTITQQTLTDNKESIDQLSSQEKEEQLIEENNILPSFLFELVKEYEQQEKKNSLVDTKLMLARPDGSEKKTLHTVKLAEEDDEGNIFILRPVWSHDCKRIFYLQGYNDIFCAGSLDISTGKTYIHMPTSGNIAVSPDDKWIASFIKDDNTLVTATLDGRMCNYFKPEFEIDDDISFLLSGIFWSPDSKKVFIVGEESSLYAVDITSGLTELYTDPDAKYTSYYTLSSDGNKLFYLADSERNDNGIPVGTVSVRYMNIQDHRTGTVFTLGQFPRVQENEEEMFSITISPNGKTILLRSIIEEDGMDKPALIFLDGKTQKIVKTDRWLFKPLYSESDLVFEEKLIGNWIGEEGQIDITKGSKPRTYRLKWFEDSEETDAVANLIEIKGMMLLGMFFDESILENKDAPNSHLLPDVYIRIIQIEPKLLMQALDYEELAEIMERTKEFNGSEDISSEDIVEFERVDSL